MNRSQNEIRSVVSKAAVAIGVPYGLAELAGSSAAWLYVNGYDGISAVGRAVDNLSRGIAKPVMLDCHARHLHADVEQKLASVFYAAPSVTDLLGVESVATIAELDEPLLLVGSLVQCSKLQDTNFALQFTTTNSDTSLTINRGELNRDQVSALNHGTTVGFNVHLTAFPVSESDVKRSKRKSAANMRARQHSDAMIEEYWYELENLAKKTLVPESSKSQEHGAGAGLIDND